MIIYASMSIMEELTGKAKAEQLVEEQRAHERQIKELNESVGDQINRTVSTESDKNSKHDAQRLLRRAQKYYVDNKVDKTNARYYLTDDVDMTLRQRRSRYIKRKFKEWLPRIICAALILAIIGVVIGMILARMRAKNEYNAHHGKCTAATVKMYNKALTGDQEQMTKLRSTVESTEGWRGDPNCVYMMTVEGMINSRPAIVKDNYGILKELKKKGYTIDDTIQQPMTNDDIEVYIKQSEE